MKTTINQVRQHSSAARAPKQSQKHSEKPKALPVALAALENLSEEATYRLALNAAKSLVEKLEGKLKKSAAGRNGAAALPMLEEAAASDRVTLVFESPDGREFARVDFPAIIYAKILAVCQERGQSVMQFIEEAVAWKLGTMTAASATPVRAALPERILSADAARYLAEVHQRVNCGGKRKGGAR